MIRIHKRDDWHLLGAGSTGDPTQGLPHSCQAQVLSCVISLAPRRPPLSHSGVSINPFILPYSLIHYTAHPAILNMCIKHLLTYALRLLIIYLASSQSFCLSVSFRHVLKLPFLFRLEALQTLPTLTCIVQLLGLSPFNSFFLL